MESFLVELKLLHDLCGWSETSNNDRQKYCIYRWDRLLECEKLIDNNRNKLVIERAKKYSMLGLSLSLFDRIIALV